MLMNNNTSSPYISAVYHHDKLELRDNVLREEFDYYKLGYAEHYPIQLTFSIPLP